MPTDVSENFGTFFRLPPPLPGVWSPLSRSMTELLVARTGEQGFRIDEGAVDAARAAELPFWPGWALVDLQTNAWGDASYSLCYGPDGWTPLDGQAVHLHRHNHAHGVVLDTAEQTLAYLRFFCTFVHGPAGPFHILNAATRLWRLEGGQRRQVLGVLADPETELRTDESKSVARANVLFGREVSRCVFSIAGDGDVRMIDDDFLFADAVAEPDLIFREAVRRRMTGEGAGT